MSATPPRSATAPSPDLRAELVEALALALNGLRAATGGLSRWLDRLEARP